MTSEHHREVVDRPAALQRGVRGDPMRVAPMSTVARPFGMSIAERIILGAGAASAFATPAIVVALATILLAGG
jgi:hypothetical protein